MIWITGASGLLGQEVQGLCRWHKTPFLATGAEVDVTDIEAIYDIEKKYGKEIDWVVNCAAYTNVDGAEDEQGTCFTVNSLGARNLAIYTDVFKKKLIHISTDYVFDGTAKTPIKETAVPNPINTYGATKLAGERNVLTYNPNSVILRTAWLYGEYGKNFITTMLRLMNEKQEISIVNDQHGCPTWGRELAIVIYHITRSSYFMPEIYNYVSRGETTWYDYANYIYAIGTRLKLIHNKCKIIPVSSDQFPTKAKRPKYSVLDTFKIQDLYKVKPPLWKNGVESYLKEMSCAHTS